MARAIDQKIVQMKMDDSDFTSKVKSVLSRFTELNSGFNKLNSANVSGAANGIGAIGTKAGMSASEMSKLASSVDFIASKFTVLGQIGQAAIANITNRMIDMSSRVLKGATIQPLIDGYNEYTNKLSSINVIMNNVPGAKLIDVKNTLAELNKYADQTIYSFEDMTSNMGTFTAAGVSLEDSATAIQGIGNLAASSGSNTQQMSMAMYQLSQALAAGKVGLQDWNSVVNAGMGGQKFQKALSATAKELGHGRNEAVSFRDSLQDGWLTSEVLLKTLAKFKDDKSMQTAATQVKSFGDLVDTTAEGLGSAWAQVWENILGDSSEAPKLWTGVANAIQKPIQAMDNYNKSTSKAFHDLGGRDAIIGALTNLFSSLAKILGTVAKAFGEIFPPATGKQLTDMAKGFEKFTEGLKVSDGTLRNIHDIFKAFFNTIKIGINIVKMVTGVLVGLIPPGIPGMILNVLGTFARFILALEAGKVKIPGVTGALDLLHRGFLKVNDILKESGNVFDAFVSIVKDAIPALESFASKVLNKLGQAFDIVKSKIKGVFSGGDSLDLSTIFAAGSLGGIALFVKKMSGAFEDLTEFFKKGGPLQGIIGSAKSMLGGLTDALNTFTTSVKVKSILLISGAMLALAAALKILASIDAKDVFKALEMLGVMLLAMNISLNSLGKMTGSVARAMAAAVALNALALAINEIAIAVYAFGKMSPDTLIQGIVGITTVLIPMVAALEILSKQSTKSVASAAALILLATAVDMIAVAIAGLAMLPADGALQGVASISAIILVLGAFVKIVDKAKFSMGTAASVVALSVAINLMAAPIIALGLIDYMAVVQGLTAMAGILIELGAFVTIVNGLKMGTVAVQMLALSAALVVITGVIFALGSMSMEQLIQGLTGLAGALIIMAAAVNLMRGSLAGAAAMTVLAVALNIMMIPLMAFANMNVVQIVSSLTMLAGVFVVLGVAAYALGPVAPALLILSAAVALLGVGLLGVGVGLAAFATGLLALAGMGAGAILALGTTINGLLDILIAMVPKLVELGVQLVEGFVLGITEEIPTVVQALLEMVINLLETLDAYLPEVIDRFINLMENIVMEITGRIPDIVQTMTTFIVTLAVSLAQALGDNAYTIINAGVQLMIKLINAMAQAIRDNQDEIVQAMMGALEALLEAVITALQQVLTALFGWIPGFKGMMSSAGSQAKDALRDAFGIDETAKGKAQGAVDGVAGKSGDMNAAGQKLAQSGMAGLATMNANGKGSEKGQDFANGIGGKSGLVNGAGSKLSQSGVAGANTGNFNGTGSTKGSDFAGGLRGKGGEANGAGSHLASRAKDGAGSQSLEGVGSDAGNGFARGISSVGGAVWNAAASLAQKAMDAIKKTQNSHSPSKETAKLGSYFGQGYTNGIDDQASNVVSSAQSMVSAALGVVAQSGKDINQALEDNLNLQPTITPVIDGSGMSYAGSFGATLEPSGSYLYGQNGQNGQGFGGDTNYQTEYNVNVYPTNDMTEAGIHQMANGIVDAIKSDDTLNRTVSNMVIKTTVKGTN